MEKDKTAMIKRKKPLFLSGFLVLIILLLVNLYFTQGCLKKDKDTTKQKTTKATVKKPELIYCPVDHEQVSSQEDLGRPIFIMVENSYPSRPQAGLNSACLVMEGLTEGGITRLGLVFAHENPEKIGPVRSARTHFVSFAFGFDAIYAHCGGSKYALKEIKEMGITDFDQFRYASAFWRDKGKKAPHNLFTNLTRIRQTAENNGIKLENIAYQGFEHKKTVPIKARPDSGRLIIRFSRQQYEVLYEYNKEKNTFARFNGGKPHLDALDNQQVEVANIVVMYAKTINISDKDGVLDVEMIGTGKTEYFIDGQKTEGSWKKVDNESQILFKDINGNPVQFNSGQIWVEVVKLDTPVIWESVSQE